MNELELVLKTRILFLLKNQATKTYLVDFPSLILE